MATISSVGDDFCVGIFGGVLARWPKGRGEKVRKSHNSSTERGGFSRTGGYEE